MSTPRSSTALLILDPFNDFLSEDGKLFPYAREVIERLDMLANLERLVAAARSAELLRVFVPHRQFETGDFEGWKYLCPTHAASRQLRPFELGSWGADYHPSFRPQPGELIVHEHWLHNGFANTDLALQLQVRGVDRVLIAGMRANACVEATARHAVELGYHVTLVKDASAAFRWEEWVATMEINAKTFAHAIVSTEQAISAIATTAANQAGPAST